MTLSDRFRTAAQNLINKVGKSITYIVVSAGEYDKDTGSTVLTKTEKAIKGVVYAYSQDDIRQYVFGATGGAERMGLIQVGDVRLTIAALDISAPNVADRVKMDGLEWVVMSVKQNIAGDAVATYDLHMRRA